LRRARGKTYEAVFETDGSELGASFARAEELSDDVLAAIEYWRILGWRGALFQRTCPFARSRLCRFSNDEKPVTKNLHTRRLRSTGNNNLIRGKGAFLGYE
jgi:hypothetical protein